MFSKRFKPKFKTTYHNENQYATNGSPPQEYSTSQLYQIPQEYPPHECQQVYQIQKQCLPQPSYSPQEQYPQQSQPPKEHSAAEEMALSENKYEHKPTSHQSLMTYPIDSNNVKVLFDGYSKCINGDYFANCSCVLIKGGPNIIIDTMTVWDEDKLVKAIRKENLTCNDIDFVICTHGHSDHTGCNHLFKKAIHIVGFSISFKDQYYLHPDFKNGEDFNLDPSTNAIRVIPTPGHTLQDVTVLVYTNIGIIAITGDLFEKEEDVENEQEWILAGSDNQAMQRRNRKKILKLADYIVPGHGPMFKVPDKFKIIMQETGETKPV